LRRLLLILLAAGCASPPDGDADAGATVRFVVEGTTPVLEGELMAAARRELRDYAERGRRTSALADAAWSMEARLRERGYAHGKVAFRIEGEVVFFEVTEGPQALFAGVRFRGVSSVPVAELEKFFVFEGAGAFGAGPPLFILSQVTAAADDVQHYYLLSGYYRVVVEEPEVEWNEERSLASVTVAVEEGPQYRVTAVEFAGVEPREVGLVGEPYHVRLPVEAAAKVKGALLAEGRQFARVVGRAELDHEKAKAVLHVEAEPGPVVRLNEVTVEGNDRTKLSFLRRRIPVEDGDELLQEAVDQALENLYRTRLFGSVRHRIEPVGPEDEGLADLEIRLDELEARSVDFEVGYGSYELLRGAVRYNDLNLFGIARRLGVEVKGSMKSYGASVRLEDPYLLGERNTINLGAEYFLRIEPSFDRQLVKFDFSVRHQFAAPYAVRVGYSFKAEEAQNVTGEIPGAEEEFVRTAGVFATFMWDTRDRALDPSRGFVGECGVLYSSPILGADLDFFALRISGSTYLRLTEKMVVAVGARFHGREILDERETLPIQERLFAGGASSVRSFGQDELGPTNVDGAPTGGLTVAEAFIELRAQLWRSLYGAVFYDIGMVSPKGFDFQGPPGHAVGVGLRYMLPVGPVRVDFGYNPGPTFAAKRPWAIHVAVGFFF
jgi:outer membrane protein assembly complex protein YaeT